MSNFSDLLSIALAPVQRLENAIQQVKVGFNLADAVGAQLTVLGNLVGQPRHGITDDDVYRRYVSARVAVNRSQGVSEDVIRVAQLAIADDDLVVVLTNSGQATVDVDVTSVAIDETTAAILLELLSETVSGGVRVIMHYAVSAPAGLFRYDVGPGYDVGHYAGAEDQADV